METDTKVLTLLSLKTMCTGHSAQTGGSGRAPSPPELLCALGDNAVG